PAPAVCGGAGAGDDAVDGPESARGHPRARVRFAAFPAGVPVEFGSAQDSAVGPAARVVLGGHLLAAADLAFQQGSVEPLGGGDELSVELAHGDRAEHGDDVVSGELFVVG